MAESTESQTSPSVTLPPATKAGGLARVWRLILPLMFLGMGWFAFDHWMQPEVREKRQRGLPQLPKTRVIELTVVDFEPQIETSGVIRAHNQITLTSQVSGRIVATHPQFEDGAYFEEGTILVELDKADFKTAVASAKSQQAQALAILAQEQTRAKQARLDWEDLGYEEEPSDLVLRVPQLREAEARVEAAAAQLEQAERGLERCQIRAPFDGRMRQRMVGVSQTIGSGTSLASIFAVDYAEVRLPIEARHMRFLELPEEASDSPVKIILRDALDESNKVEREAWIVRTEGALNEQSLDLFAIARIDDPFGRESGKAPLRIGQPVSAKVPGRPFEKVVVIPRKAVRQLSRITVVDRDSHIITKRMVTPLWENDTDLIVSDEFLVDGTLLATAYLVYTPDGTPVEILPDPSPEGEPPVVTNGNDDKTD
ncbi:efflux RND transporter periplasmic adaptor subunit [Akkermansiaceae bacterium]|jgi:RND family efflux transporter MFP subunit|nr:efflux RND transporter periplasmic adaptor subunit [Verrucomicrobiota bacterium]MDA7503183.1 efflux RND transporter periplasmic adaptor subunit [bacterium]MDA7504362.1 efflux RND transporter periplasmic adaptor subunit [Akkermansiaceae bacterium]MBT6167151.1 efflux RND transporter periplasmic adaptor subunit [Verrucomicrobiota bacterium]MDA7506804.1 efflux RND transporter periplasmic adaptor subunit [Akkermansiaceae bacterium]